jgi:hypothetical protein
MYVVFEDLVLGRRERATFDTVRRARDSLYTLGTELMTLLLASHPR